MNYKNKVLIATALSFFFNSLCYAEKITNLQTEAEFSDFQMAISALQNGQTLELSPGKFTGKKKHSHRFGRFMGYEPLEIKNLNGITIRGSGVGTDIKMIRLANSNNITIENTTISGSFKYINGKPVGALRALESNGGDRLILNGNRIISGISVNGGKNHLLARNIVHGKYHNNLVAYVKSIALYHNYFGIFSVYRGIGPDGGFPSPSKGGILIDVSNQNKLIVKNNIFTVPDQSNLFSSEHQKCDIDINLNPGSNNFQGNYISNVKIEPSGGVVRGWSLAQEKQNNTFLDNHELDEKFYPLSGSSPVIDQGVVLNGVPNFVTLEVTDGKPDVGAREFEGRLFVTAEGKKLFQGSNEIRFKSIAFTNNYWEENDAFTNNFTLLKHHRLEDFIKAKKLGFNSVRFALNADWFSNNVSNNSNRIWTWLKNSVAMAKESGMLIILDMHQPPGETWLSDDSAKRYNANSNVWFWNDPSKRNKLVALWGEIARRYKNNSTIAAYGILNEPITSDDDGEEWYTLAQEIINTIRSKDTRHLLLIDEIRGHAVTRTFEDPDSGNQVTRKILSYTSNGIANPKRIFSDSNVIYDFHFYEPGQFTHKGAIWGGGVDDGSVYPDTVGIIVNSPDDSFWDINWQDSFELDGSNPSGTTWIKYKSKPAVLNDNAVKLIHGEVAIDGLLGSRKVFIDDMSIEILDEDITLTNATESDWSQLRHIDVTEASVGGFYPVAWNGSDADVNYDLNHSFKISNTFGSGVGDNTSLILTDNKTSPIAYGSGLAQVSASNGRIYRYTAMIRVQGILPAGVTVNPTITFYSDQNNETFRMDKSYLRSAIQHWKTFSDSNNVPVSCFEFATIINAYKHDDIESSGGEIWLADVIDILNSNDFSWSLWAYRNEPMGLFFNDNADENLNFSEVNKNQPILDTLKSIMGPQPVILWTLGLEYVASALVEYQGVVYKSLMTHTDYSWTPSSSPSLWEEVLPVEDNIWAVGRAYVAGDIISYRGSQYTCLQTHTAHSDTWTPDATPALWYVN